MATTQAGGIRLSVVAPAFNEAAGIRDVLEEWQRYLQKAEPSYEIIICDDGSTDRTWQVLEEIARSDSRIRNLRYDNNEGAAVAIREAIAHSRGEWVLTIDSDGQFPIAELRKLQDRQRQTGADAVIGARRTKQDRLVLRIGSSMSSAAARFLLGTDLRDFTCAMMLVRGDLLRRLQLEARGLNYSTDIAAKLLEARASVAQQQIHHRARTRGMSKLRLLAAAQDRLTLLRYLRLRRTLLRRGIITARRSAGQPLRRGVNWRGG